MPLAEWTRDHAPARAIAAPITVSAAPTSGERPCDHPLRVRPEPLHPGAVQDQRPHAPVRNCRPQHGQTLAGAGQRPYQRVTDRRPQPLHRSAVQDQRPQAATRQHRPQCRQALAHVRERPNERATDCRPQPVHRSAVPDKRGVRDPRRPRRQPRHARRRTCHDPTRRGTHSRPHPGHAGAVARKHPTDRATDSSRAAPEDSPHYSLRHRWNCFDPPVEVEHDEHEQRQRSHREREEQCRLTGRETCDAVFRKKPGEHGGRDDDRACGDLHDQLCSAFHAASSPITIPVAVARRKAMPCALQRHARASGAAQRLGPQRSSGWSTSHLAASSAPFAFRRT